MTLLAIENLHTHFVARDRFDRVRVARALNGVSFTLDSGEVLGLVGETGAGKSLTALSVLGLLRPPARIVAGSVKFDGAELLGRQESSLNALRGGDIALVVQSPRTSLDPLTRIGEQIARVVRVHRGVGAEDARQRALQMLAAVGIPDPPRRYEAWPHELSGGMAQRVLIAMALANEPRLLIADEPTTGLDVTVQAQILDLLRAQARQRSLATLIITHDLGIVAQYADRVAVMFAGSVVETGDVRAVFSAPAHPYTQALLACMPERIRLGTSIHRAGAPPDLYALPPGCPYADRCPSAAVACRRMPEERALGDGHRVRCHQVEGSP